VERKVDGERIRARRKELGWTQAELATKSGQGLRTIADAESGRRTPRLGTLETIAQTLGLPLDAIYYVPIVEPPATDPAPSAAAPPKRAPLVAPTPLRTLVLVARDLPPLADFVTADGAIATLGPKLFQDIATAFATFEGERFCVRGHVETHHDIGRAEARLLATRGGVGARFHIEVPVGASHALGVTTHTRDAASTKTLLAREGKSVTLVVRVVVAPEDADAGFTFFMARGPKPWALVVESVVEER
jgi:DNA-binding XRE family transcriptional regulator